MSVISEVHEDVVMIKVRGNLDGGKYTEEVHSRIMDLIHLGATKVIVDISRVKWLTGEGLGMIMSCMSALHCVNGNLGMVVATDNVKKLFMITGLMKPGRDTLS